MIDHKWRERSTDSSRPVRTFNTAVVYYHKFRLVHADNEYNYIVWALQHLTVHSCLLTNHSGCSCCRSVRGLQDRGHAKKVPRDSLRRVQSEDASVGLP